MARAKRTLPTTSQGAAYRIVRASQARLRAAYAAATAATALNPPVVTTAARGGGQRAAAPGAAAQGGGQRAASGAAARGGGHDRCHILCQYGPPSRRRRCCLSCLCCSCWCPRCPISNAFSALSQATRNQQLLFWANRCATPSRRFCRL